MRRYETLDSLRGVAALIVVFHHCWMTASPSYWEASFLGIPLLGSWNLWLHQTPLKLFVGGRPPVILFFVLSGFVLTLALRPGKGSYLEFALRRLCRIYVPFFVAICAAIGLYMAIRPSNVLGLSEWFNHSWSLPLSPALVTGHFLMIGRDSYITLDNPMWSLVHELRISMIFPILALFCVRWPRLTLLGTLVIYGLSVSVLPLVAPDTVARSLAETPQYLLMFAVGSVMANHRVELGAWIARQPNSLVLAAWLGCLVLLMAPGTRIALSTLCFTAGAAGLIALAISPKASLLTAAPLKWLGKVSFSLYLTHLLVLLSVFHLLNEQLPFWVLLLVVISFSLIFAEIFYLLVEKPSMRLGRKIVFRETAQLESVRPT